MADGGGIGISPLVVLQARTQAETAWSAAEMHSVFSAATAKLLLGGSTDTAFLKDMAELLGDREIDRRSHSYSDQGTSMSVQRERQALVTIEEMRRMPQRLGLLVYRNIRPVLLALDAWIDRADARDIRAAKASTETAQREVFAEQASQAQAWRERYARPDVSEDDQ
jgi:type IV secretory pathway TraG/TraD family ATPase VirD4